MNQQYAKTLQCPCGESFVTFHGKYCSSACRKQYGQYVRGVAVYQHTCEGCGEQFEVPWQRKRRFCSNACAKRGIIQGQFTTGLIAAGKVTLFQSTYELRFVAACERFQIPWHRYDGPGFETSEGVYRPDFIIETGGKSHLVEVKGFMDDVSLTKVSELSGKGVELTVVTLALLERIEAGEPLMQREIVKS